jgi:hypothetical protein
MFTPLDISLKLAVSVGIGMLVGLEREWSQKIWEPERSRLLRWPVHRQSYVVLGVLVGQDHHYTPVAAAIVMTLLLSMEPGLTLFSGARPLLLGYSALLGGMVNSTATIAELAGYLKDPSIDVTSMGFLAVSVIGGLVSSASTPGAAANPGDAWESVGADRRTRYRTNFDDQRRFESAVRSPASAQSPAGQKILFVSLAIVTLG